MSAPSPIRLGINIDHIATLRNARGGHHPDPLRAAVVAIEAGADNITAHLREDRRHITDDDMERLIKALKYDEAVEQIYERRRHTMSGEVAREVKPLSCAINLEMAVTDEMLQIALKQLPDDCCLVPERRQELTTEGGLDVAGQTAKLKPFIESLRGAGIQVALFIDPDREQISAAQEVGADAVELHTGTYCKAFSDGAWDAMRHELMRLQDGAYRAASLGLEVHAGHGLDYDNVGPVAAIPEIVELNIGHFLVGEALFIGLAESVRRMRVRMDRAREILRHSDTESEVGSTS
jgi:pyridoxine 5-phosphate synthase